MGQSPAQSWSLPCRHAPIGRGDVVHPIYWFAAGALIVATMLRVPLDQPAALVVATIVFVGGGLPHGAYDIALVRRATDFDRSAITAAVGVYVAMAGLMALLWMTLPLIALVLFLAVAALHFGEDWQMLDEPLLRFAAGAAVIAAPTIGQGADVTSLFQAMSDARAVSIAQVIVAAAPVSLLVTAVGIVLAWRNGARQWASAMTLCFGLLLILPPVAGFALFFVFLHSPRHIAESRVLLNDMTRVRWLATGVFLSGAAVIGWWVLQELASSRLDRTITAQAFQLLSAVAVPHLVLSRWLERRLARSRPAGSPFELRNDRP